MGEDSWLAVFDTADNTGDGSESSQSVSFQARCLFVYLSSTYAKSNKHAVCLIEKKPTVRNS